MFFHVSYYPYETDAVIKPGSYGRTAREFKRGLEPIHQHFAALMWEVALETARITVNADLLSRLNCIFVWDTFDDARMFKSEYRKDNFVFEVEPIDSSYKTFRGDYEIIKNREEPYIDYMPKDAVRYWRGESSKVTETMIACPMRVVRRIN